METRNISLTLEEAREWYNSNIILKDVALKAFTKEELEVSSFKDIKSFKDACKALNLCYNDAIFIANYTSKISRASAAMFKLNIIRKALNLGQTLNFAKESENLKKSYIYYPYNPIISEDKEGFERNCKVGKFKCEGKEYYVLGGEADYCSKNNLSGFDSTFGVGTGNTNCGFLGCATKEIAQHFGKYFGMLITEAKYGDLPGFEVIINEY